MNKRIMIKLLHSKGLKYEYVISRVMQQGTDVFIRPYNTGLYSM